VTSRRKAEDLISQERVKVNGTTISRQGFMVSDGDDVVVDGKLIKPESRKIYILLNKPEGVISSVKDQVGRSTVLDYIKGFEERLYPVGRLDYDSSGLIIVTNDGEFTNYMTHPSHEVDKTYIAVTDRDVATGEIEKLRRGVDIGGYVTGPAKVSTANAARGDMIRISIHEGRNRQVRRMLEAVGAKVVSLERIGIGNVFDSKLGAGKWRNLTQKELRGLGYDSE
jgi:23S rRNA pseudouridine2605 synthase